MKQKKILIIEDNEASLKLLDTYLRKEGYKTIVGQNGYEGLNLARKEKPDLIVLDLMLPGLDGYEVCRRLKEDQQTSHLPIMVLSARYEQEGRSMARDMGADAYVPKPFSSSHLYDVVRTLLDGHALPI